MSVEDKIASMEKTIDRTVEKVENHADRVSRIETYFKLAIAIATIFGISGGVIFSQINSVSKKIKNLDQKLATLQETSDNLQSKIGNLNKDAENYKQDVIAAIGDTGAKQKAALTNVISSVTPDDLAQGFLKGTLKNLKVMNCGSNGNCKCPEHYERAAIEGGNGDLNRGAKGDYIFICVQYH